VFELTGAIGLELRSDTGEIHADTQAWSTNAMPPERPVISPGGRAS